MAYASPCSLLLAKVAGMRNGTGRRLRKTVGKGHMAYRNRSSSHRAVATLILIHLHNIFIINCDGGFDGFTRICIFAAL
ncbi:hypothetical protein IE53DRAFT_384392 [Violaceomyces palustris]|uniref:Uncharacterized protein n=1 Tax=Violaceomyces palustris TaxID=1673888 RepID=A0ACD0P4Z3_9BASI|nr:hypothetical protein IE53DRAFT_384392 [Violaceomyces palustris]